MDSQPRLFQNLPKVGQTRCYWALLNADLDFIYLDPVLQSHLEDQAPLLRGKSLLSFVHPDEQASAKLDLGGVLESRTLHGSVTRVRYSRLSKVRRLLGYDGPPPPWQDADKIALDSNYMAVDIVINWAAEGLVLCFIHAIVDLSPTDNDEHHKTGWTNWCGTPLMDNNQIQMCYNYLIASVQTPQNMSRIFQILDNRDGRPLLLSWPPDQGQGTQHPNARDFAQLVENAQIGTTNQDDNNAKTSCTRRYKAFQAMPSVPGSQVESIFIPHGSVIFACHKVTASPPSRSTTSSSATMQQLGYSYPPPTTSYYDSPSSSSYALPPLSSSQAYPSPSTSFPYAPTRWADTSDYPSSSTQQQQQQWGSGTPSPAHSVSSLPPAVSNLRAGSYPPHTSQHFPPPPTFVDAGAGFPRSGSPYNNNNNGNGGYSPSEAGSLGDEVPPARRRSGDGTAPTIPGGRSASNRPNGVLKCSSCGATSSPEWRKGPSGKKELCNACGLRYARSRAKREGTANTTQRRRKDKSTGGGGGTVVSGGITKREASSTPPYHHPHLPGTSASAPAVSSMRRSFDGVGVGVGSSLSASVGAPSGEMYPHAHHVLEDTKAGLKLTPSPSPPMGFVHYASGPGPGHAHHQHPHPHPHHAHGGQFYNVPSPLSHTVPLDDEPAGGGGGAGPGVPGPGVGLGGVGVGVGIGAGLGTLGGPGVAIGQGPLNGNGNMVGPGQPQQQQQQQLPSMAAYVGRSPLSTMPPASFERDRGEREKERERERERERELPLPLGLGVERHGRRILAQQG